MLATRHGCVLSALFAIYRLEEILIKLIIRLDHHDIAAAIERLLIRSQATHEGIELGILVVRLCINSGSERISLSANNLGLSECIGFNDSHLAISGGTN